MKLYFQVLVALLIGPFATANEIHSRIVGGTEASIGEFPFIVSLQDSMGHFCGGSLIRPNWVLTAAHCTAGKLNRVVIGLHNLNDTHNAEIIKPKRVIKHPKYNEKRTDYDYALVELSRNSTYPTVTLNTTDFAVTTDPAIEAVVAGWGVTKENSFDLPVKLQKVEVPLIPKSICSKNYKGMITDQMLCAGYAKGGKDSCQGDSGGPLIATADDNKTYLIGVVSWGEGCARKNKPGIYSKVSAAIPWIKKMVK